MKTKVNTIKMLLAVWVNRTIKSLGLWMAVAALFAVSANKLDTLQQARQNLPADYKTAAQVSQELECLTRNIYWEASGEPFVGKVGVAQVTMNRVSSGKFADSVCGVVYQKNVFYQKVVCQFSWYCENNHRIRPVDPVTWSESHEVAKKVLLENFRLPGLEQALFYHSDSVQPGWKLPKITKIGRHTFYGAKS